MKRIAQSIHKFEPNVLNEDAARVFKHGIVVADGAGGGGVFAERWAKYLTKLLPKSPIKSFEAFNKWLDGIWENFYNRQEKEAKKIGGLFLNKFYDEGSFATLAALWKIGKQMYWISYGDSVVFCYHRKQEKLEYTFGSLEDFANPPYLVNLLNPCVEEGFRVGKFSYDKDCVYFIASDTLSQYIIMMYLYARKDFQELNTVARGNTKFANIVKSLLQSEQQINFQKDVLAPLFGAVSQKRLAYYLRGLWQQKLLGHDDYSLAICGKKTIK